MELKDTIDLMNSDDFRDRFVAEYCQTKIRYEKLHKMLIKYETKVRFGRQFIQHICADVFIISKRY